MSVERKGMDCSKSVLSIALALARMRSRGRHARFSGQSVAIGFSRWWAVFNHPSARFSGLATGSLRMAEAIPEKRA
jgi:hypothetical protein